MEDDMLQRTARCRHEHTLRRTRGQCLHGLAGSLPQGILSRLSSSRTIFGSV